MTKVNIISGFLGAGKTTFIKRLISDVFKGEKLVLIENEFGEIGVDGGFLKDAGIEITEMNSGCICCSLVGDFTEALRKTIETYSPDRIIIEPSGVGKLSDVIAAVEKAGASIDASITVADCTKCKMYAKNFGEFYKDQIAHADCILLTRTDKADEQKIEQAYHIIREINADSNIITTHLDKLSNEQIKSAFKKVDMAHELMHDHHHHDEHCSCGHDHHHDEHCSCGHDHHHHDEHCSCGHDHHHHDEHCSCGHDHHHHDEHCSCGHDHHHHDEHCSCGHDHHHADETFTSWGFETAAKYSKSHIEDILALLDSGDYGDVLRAKGMVESENSWIYFDYVPQEHDVREGEAYYTGKICVIGANLNEEKLAELFSK